MADYNSLKNKILQRQQAGGKLQTENSYVSNNRQAAKNALKLYDEAMKQSSLTASATPSITPTTTTTPKPVLKSLADLPKAEADAIRAEARKAVMEEQTKGLSANDLQKLGIKARPTSPYAEKEVERRVEEKIQQIIDERYNTAPIREAVAKYEAEQAKGAFANTNRSFFENYDIALSKQDAYQQSKANTLMSLPASEIAALIKPKTTNPENKDFGAKGVDWDYEYINDINGTRSKAKSQMIQFIQKHQVKGGNKNLKEFVNNLLDNSPYKHYDKYDYLKEEEIAVYNFIYERDGKKDAQQYLESLQSTLEARKAEDVKNEAYDFGQNIPVISDAAAIGLSFASAAQYAASLPLSASTGRTRRILTADASNAIRKARTNSVDWKIGDFDVFDFVYNTGMSGLESAAAMATLGPAGGVVLGLNAAAQTTNDLLDRGAASHQALAGGITAGVFEGLFEHLSIGQIKALKGSTTDVFKALFKETGKSGAKVYIKQLGKDLAKSMAVNATEEGLTEIANIVYDTVANGDISNYALLVEKYMTEQGLSEQEARDKAATDLALQVAEAGASGALMGIGFGAGATTLAYRDAKTQTDTIDNIVKQIEQVSNAPLSNLSAADAKFTPEQKAMNKVTGYKELTEDQRKLRDLGQQFGAKVKFENLTREIKNEDGTTEIFSPEGRYDKDTNTIILNTDVQENHRPALFILKHELTHSIEKAGLDYEKFMGDVTASEIFDDYVKQRVDANTGKAFENADEWYAYIEEKYRKAGQPLGGNGVSERTAAKQEAIADFVGDVLFGGNNAATEKLLNALKPAERNRFVAWVKEIIAKLKKVFAGTPNLTEIQQLENEFIEVANKVAQMNAAEAEKSTKQKPTTEEGSGKQNDLVGKTAKENVEKVNVSIDEKTNSASPSSYSLASWEQSEYVKNRNTAAKELADALGLSQKKAKDYIDSINSIAKVIADDRNRLDYVAARGRSTFVSNAEYGGSVDCSTLCPKRKILTGTFSAIQKALNNSALTAEEILDIRNRMKEKGLEVSCGLCYVEGSRAQMGKFSKEFIERYKKTNPEYVPDMFDVNTPEGIEQLRIDHPEVYEAYEKFWNNKGVLNEGDSVLFASQQKPKLYQTRTDYKGEILDKFKSEGNVVEKNKNGGLRLQSFSDFEIVHLIDMMQVIMDMSRVGLAGQAYTKVPDFALAFGKTGLKINLSLIAKGVDENGKLIFDDVEGMPIDTAIRIRDMFSDNVGTILVAFNDAQLKAALADDRVDFIIPFHRSQWKKAQYEKLGLPKGTKDYTYQQNERYIKPVYYTTRNGTVGKRKAKNYMPNEYWDFSKTGKKNAENYLKMCAENNKRPKFYKLLVDNKDGSYSLQPDGSTDGYWKLLIDFKMYNNEGVGVPQQPVKPDFNMEESLRMLEEYKGGHQQFPVDQGTVDEFVKDYKAKHKMDDFVETNNEAKSPNNTYSNFSYSLPEIDNKYMSAVENGDMETAQRMVDEAAREAGLNSPMLYHGTKMFGFTRIKTTGVEEGVDWSPFFAASKEEMSATYVPYGKTRDISSTMDDDAIEEAREIAIEERKENIADLVDDFRRLIDGNFSPWVFGQTDNSYLEGLVEKANPEAGYGDGVYDVLSEIVYDSFYDYEDEFGEYEDADDWAENSPEGNEIFAKITEIEGEKSALHHLEQGEELGGIYKLYANLDNMYVVDGKGAAWNELRPEGLPKLERYGHKDVPYKTRDVAKWARENGFYGVIFKNIRDNGAYGRTPAGDVYVFFNPESQVKSADPVTYDDKGNVIPLSERFNVENNDIRYSLPENVPTTDSRGVELSKGQQKFFAESRLRDELGRLLVLYHGTTNGGFTKFLSKFSDDGLSFFLANTAKLSATYSGSEERIELPEGKKGIARLFEKGTTKGKGQAGIYEVYANAKNPYVLECNGAKWDALPFNEKIKGYTIINAEHNFDDEHNILHLKFTIDGETHTESFDFNHLIDRAKESVKDHSKRDAESIYPSVFRGFAIEELAKYYGKFLDNEDAIGNLAHYSGYTMKLKGEKIVGLQANKVYQFAFNKKNGDFETVNTRFVSSWAKKNGYDSVVFKNIRDTGGNGFKLGINEDGLKDFVSKEDIVGDVIIVYDSSQIKSVDNLNPTKNKDIRYSLPENATAEEIGQALLDGEITMEQYRTLINKAVDRAVQASGAIEQGEMVEAPNKPVDVPKSVKEGTKVSQHVRTILESGYASPDMEAFLKDNILKGLGSYTPSTNEEKLKRVTKTIQDQGYQNALNGWRNELAKSVVDDNTVARGEALLRLAMEHNSGIDIVNITADLAELSTRTAKSLQAFSLLKRMGGMGQLVYIQRAVNRINQDLVKKFGEKNATVVKVDNKLAELLAKAETEGEYEVLYAKIIQNIADQVPASFLDKWNAWRYMAMLFNPTTHFRNIAGNGIFLPVVRTKDLLALGMERFIKQEERTKVLKVQKQYQDYANEDFKLVENLLTGTGKYNPSDNIRDQQTIFKTKVLERLRRFNFGKLEQEDAIFLRRHYRHALGSFLQARKIDLKNISSEQLTMARDYAFNEALKATYRDASKITNMISQISKTGKVANVIVEGVLPFKKTPINILKRGMEYSPIGLIKTLSKGIYDLSQKNITISQFIDGLAAGTTGAIPFIAGIFLALSGVVQGGFDDEKEFDKLMGKQKYSIRIGDLTYTVDWAVPASIPFFMGVAMAEYKADEDGDFLSNLAKFGLKGFEPILNLSMLSGINDVISSVSYAEEAENIPQLVGTAVESYFSQALPTIFSKTANVFDSTRRTTYIDKTSDVPAIFQRALDKIYSKVPGLSQNRAAYVDAWGETKYTGNFFARFFQQFVSPGYASVVNEQDITEETLRLYRQTGEKSVVPSTPAKYFKIKGIRRDLSKEEYFDYATLRGQTQAELVDEAIHSAEYAKLTDEQKVKVIEDIYSFANNLAKSSLDYSYEEVAAMEGGQDVLTQSKWGHLNSQAKRILINDYFFKGSEAQAYKAYQYGQSATDVFIKAAKKNK